MHPSIETWSRNTHYTPYQDGKLWPALQALLTKLFERDGYDPSRLYGSPASLHLLETDIRSLMPLFPVRPDDLYYMHPIMGKMPSLGKVLNAATGRYLELREMAALREREFAVVDEANTAYTIIVYQAVAGQAV